MLLLEKPSVDPTEEFLESEFAQIVGLEPIKQQLRAMLRGTVPYCT